MQVTAYDGREAVQIGASEQTKMYMNRWDEIVTLKERHVVEGSCNTDGERTTVESERILVCARSPSCLGRNTRQMNSCRRQHCVEGLG